MKTLSVFLAALFAMTAGEAFAFDRSAESSAQLYFAIPFGAPTKEEATPRLGFRIGYGREVVGYTGYADGGASFARGAAFDNAPLALPRGTFEFRLNIDGATGLYVNGANVEERLNALYVDDADAIVEGWLIPLGMIGLGVVAFVSVKAIN